MTPILRQMPDSTPEQVAALRAELEAVRAEMREFSATVSHDLRAPLRHIVSYVQLVQEEAGSQLDAEVLGFLATIVDSARHMGALLDGLGELSRVGNLPLVLGPVSLQALVPEVCESLSATAPGAGVKWHIGSDLPTVQADARLLRQALEHVLGNAAKFSAGRAGPEVVISRVDAGEANFEMLEVRDNGAGFQSALQGKLFKVFGRLHSAQQFPGVGMGLVLARKLLQRMDAAIAIHGEVDVGCCVQLCFKAARSIGDPTP